jgi:ankyrin repeat protein
MRFCFLLLIGLAGCGWMGTPVSPLIQAARAGDTGAIAQLASAGADLKAPGGVNHWTPLMHAIHTRQAGSVKALLAGGADVNQISGRTTALILAAGYGYTEIVRILLEGGADAEITLPGGQTALAAAVGGSNDFDQ